MEEAQEQSENKLSPRVAHLKPWMYKKGQSGNPGGRPPGPSMKEYVKRKLLTMNEEEREEFLHGVSKDILWEMAEGKAQQSGKLEVDIPKSLFELLQHAKTTTDSTGSESVQG